MPHPWIADRVLSFDSSGIRKVFELGAKLKDPINLSIGQPDFDVPDAARRAAIEAIEGRKNGYALTHGIPQLRERLQKQVDAEFGHADRKLFVTSGTSGGLVLAMEGREQTELPPGTIRAPYALADRQRALLVRRT